MAVIEDQHVRGPHPVLRSALWLGVILGVGFLASVDNIIFHQLLQWHNFYSDTTQYWRIFSDGLLHAFTTTLLFLSAASLWERRRQLSRVLGSVPFWAGVLLGAGGWQVFDGTVIHKILRLHQVREDTDNLLPYDLAWNLFGLALLVPGWLMWRRARSTTVESDRPT